MAFRSINIRAKKSFPGLYSSENAKTDHTSNKNTAVHYESSPGSDPRKNDDDCDLEDFGAILERCNGSPSKESPSRRRKLLGSLRSLRSLANLHASPSKIKQAEAPRPEPPVKAQDPCTTPLSMSPSLALLNFEQSPTDRPMFELNMHQRTISGSSLEVQHSSPVTVPGSSRQRTPYTMFLPSSTDLPAGTVPDTPGPMQRAFNRDPANYVPWQNASLTPLEMYAPSTPVLTPLPGTNLFVGDVDPELVPLPPSINQSIMQVGQEKHGYFNILVDEQPQIDSTDVSDGLACLRLVDDHSDTGKEESSASDVRNLQVSVGHCSRSEDTRCEYEDAKLQDVICATHFPPGYIRALRRKQQAQDLNDSVSDLNLPPRHQVLTLQPKQQEEALLDPARKDSAISDDWDTTSDGCSTATTAEHIDKCRTLGQSHPTNDFPNIPPSAPDGETEVRADSSPAVNLDYVVWDNLGESRRRVRLENTWGRHTGLYDGTGYGEEDSGPTTPCKPDEDTKDTPKRPDPLSIEALTALSVGGECPDKQISSERPRGEDPDTKPVREWSRLTADSHESLESIYHAYAYSFGARVSSSSNNSAHGDERRSLTKGAGISSVT